MTTEPLTAGEFPTIRRWFRLLLRLTAVFVFVAVAASCVLFVDETEYVLIERFGRIAAVYDRPEDRGLHGKWPWPIERARRFDARMQLFDPPGREVFTKDRKNLVVNPFVVWRIAPSANGSEAAFNDRPVVRFFRGMGDLELAELRLDSRLRAALAARIGQVELSDLLIADSRDRPPTPGAGPLAQLSDEIRHEIVAADDDSGRSPVSLGVELVDVRIKRVNLPAGNQQAVFERMKSERRKIADQYRGAGAAEDRMIRSRADREYGEILARAAAEAERIRGAGDAEALAVLNAAYAEDPEFARMFQSLESLREMLGGQTTLVLSSESGLWRWLTRGAPDSIPVEPPSVKSPSPSSPSTGPSPTSGSRAPLETTADETSGSVEPDLSAAAVAPQSTPESAAAVDSTTSGAAP